MLGTQNIQQYFASGYAHHVVPNVSVEWNYNLFYSPYITLNGDGSVVKNSSNKSMQEVAMTLTNWSSVSGLIRPTLSQNGRITPVVKANNGSTTRSCLNFLSSSNSGSSEITMSLPASKKTYKLTFFAKVLEDVVVDLSALAYIDYHRSHSAFHKIDSVSWTKFEVYLSSRPVDTNYDNVVISLNYASPEGTTGFHVLVDQFELFETTDFEYQYGNLWPTLSPFGHFRPGESFVPSGNSKTQLPTDFRKIKTDFGRTGGTWNNQAMPCSPVVYHPELMGTDVFNPIYKNGSLSEWSKYKYFVADANKPSITGIYDQTLNTNKIVLKFNLAYSKPTAVTVTLSNYAMTINGSTPAYTTQTADKQVVITADKISDSGLCIIYLQPDGSWSTTNWTTLPSFDFNGDVRFGGNGGNYAFAPINKITITQSDATLVSAYGTSVKDTATTSHNISSKMKRMQVVEISPRLEIDVTYFTMSVSTRSELDNKQNPLPISAISSNSATVVLSNVPLSVSNQVLSLFSNNSSSSILKGLFRNYVKFYINYIIKDPLPSGESAVVPGGIFYADTWDVKDIERTSVTLFDVSKHLQLLAPTDYVSQSEDVFRVISNVLDFAGFTDYNYDELKKVTKYVVKNSDGTYSKNSSPIQMRYFYCDSTQQKVFDVLREIFEVYQIGAYIDSFGQMRFLSIDDIFDKTKTVDMLLHDTSSVYIATTDGYTKNLTVNSNIVQDTYTETTKAKIGKATITYKTPQISKTIAYNSALSNGELFVNLQPTYLESSNVIWDSTIEESTTFNHLAQTMNKYDSYFIVPSAEAQGATGDVNFNQYGIDHDGYGIIEGEIVSFKDKEFQFTFKNSDGTTNSQIAPVTKIVSNSADLAAIKAEVLGQAGINKDVSFKPTGKIVNVQRGLFNTSVKKHTYAKTFYDLGDKLEKSGTTMSAFISTSGNIALSSYANNDAIITCKDPYVTNDYHTFSTKMMIGENSETIWAKDSLSGIVLHNRFDNPSVYIGISQAQATDANKKKYNQYRLYVTDDAGNTLLKNNQEFQDVTALFKADLKSYPANSPFSNYSKYINLKVVKSDNNVDTLYTNSLNVYINKQSAQINFKDSVILDTAGKYGVFVKGGSTSGQTIEFSEIYACQTAIDSVNYFYHYQLPWFAEKLASNKKLFEISYMVQSRPEIIGINYYEIKNAQAPSMDAYPLKIKYDWMYVVSGDLTADQKKPAPLKMTVDENSLTYSPIYHSGFKSRFAIVNNSPSQVWIKKEPDTLNQIKVDFSLVTNTLITLGNDVVIEKIFDEANVSETVDISSNWVQDRNTATSILRVIYKALDGFTRDTTISIYGNPLYEIGDIVKVRYNLKDIVDQKYFVQGVEQTFDTGLTTILTLNQIA